MQYLVTTFYKFTPLSGDGLLTIKHQLEEKAHELSLFGLTLIAPEGINATVAGLPSALERYKGWLQKQFGELTFKDSPSEKMPFKRFKVKIKDEIVQLQRTDVVPSGTAHHVSPEEWDRLLEEENMKVIDVRNWYETKLGTFKNAIDPKTETFSQFPEWLKQSGLPRYERIGIFCTGGIRCEKAIMAMKEQGYENVCQLDGGVLNYIEKRPNANFEGECFVFDHRVAVDQQLYPSATYALCWHCGNGGSIEKVCSFCHDAYKACEDCLIQHPVSFCSKDCRNRYHARIEEKVKIS